MKLLILIIALVAHSSCSTRDQNGSNPNPRAVALNDSAVALMMKFRPSALDSAHDLLNKAISVDTNYFTAYANKVSVYCRQKNFSKAVETAKHLERIQPRNPEGIFTLGFLLERSGDTEKALEKYNKAVALNAEKLENLDSSDKQYISIQTNYALHLILARQEENGKKQLDEILKKDPNNLAARMIYGKSRLEIFEGLTNKN